MSHAYQIEIITIYNAAHTPSAKTRYRVLALLSLVAAGVWLWAAWTRVDPWLTEKLFLAAFNEVIGAGSLRPTNDIPMSAEDAELYRLQMDATRRRGTVLGATAVAWKACVYLAGGWLAIAGLVGLSGSRTSLRMQRQAAILMLVSTLASVGGIWVAIKWGGMPPDADWRLYAKIAAVQSSYAWFLLITTRLVR